MTKPLRFENKSLRLKYKCLICIRIIFWAILDLFINLKYLFQNKSFSQTYYFKSEKSFVILTSLLGLKNKSREFREYGQHLATKTITYTMDICCLLKIALLAFVVSNQSLLSTASIVDGNCNIISLCWLV